MKLIWLQEVANDINLFSISHDASVKMLYEIETEMKKVILMSFKLQKRSKKTILTVDDVNLALGVLNQEKVYGLLGVERRRTVSQAAFLQKDCANAMASNVIYCNRKIDLTAYASRQIPEYPLMSEVHFHWLAVDGVQPRIHQNPEVVVYDSSAETTGLPREIAYFYTKLTRLVLSASASESSSKSIQDVCSLLSRDSDLQSLVGYLSRFLFVQIRRNLKNLYILHALLQVTQALILNPSLNIERCLHQILPGLLSCVVGARIGDFPSVNTLSSENGKHIQFPLGSTSYNAWADLIPLHIRNFGAGVVRCVVDRYRDTFPDLLPRVCKTYLQAALTQQDASVPFDNEKFSGTSGIRYGGLIGLATLGERVIGEVLLPNIDAILEKASIYEATDPLGSEQECIVTRTSENPTGPSSVIKRQDGNDYESFLMVSIINWYIRKCMCGAPRLESLDVVQSERGHKRCRVEWTGESETPISDGKDFDKSFKRWNRFIDTNAERFVPHYVGSAATLPHCALLFI